MEFMDQSLRKQYDVMLVIGYLLVGFALLLLTTVLVFVAYGFGYQNGQVIQNGLIFLSTTPASAHIFINGVRYQSDTNTRVLLKGGAYNIELERAGYRTWQRSIVVQGGQVASYTYPFLFPTSLTTHTINDYQLSLALVTQSPDEHWLLIAQPGSLTDFDLYDLNNLQSSPTRVVLSDSLLTASSEPQSLQLVAWSADSTHLLVKHVFGSDSEYLLVNRSDPTQSLNLTKTLSIATRNIEVQLSDQQYDHYFVYDSANRSLFRASLSAPQVQVYLSNVLAFTTNGNATVLFATPDVADASKVDISLYDGSSTYTIRHEAANATYELALKSYNRALYAAISASSDKAAYIYRNPVDEITTQQLGVAVPIRVFHIIGPTEASFSPTGQYVLFEHGTNFATYDLDNQQGFTYSLSDTIDAPQSHALWFSGAQLDYVTKGQLIIFDHDGQNKQSLVSADPQYEPYLDPNEKVLYTLVPSSLAHAHELLTSTALRTPADQ